MKKQYLLLLSTLLLLPTTFNDNNYVAKADSISTDDNSALVTVSHIRNNLDEFNDERAAAGYLTAVNSFTLMSITIDSYEETGIAGFLLDFDSDKGYMVVGPNMRYYDISFTGNSPVPSGNNIQRFYSDYLGYYYIDSNNVKVEIGFPNVNDNDINSTTLYDGQMAAGESLITDVQAYNDDKYGTDFIFAEEHTIFNSINMPGYMEMHLTFYYIWDGVQMTYPDMDGYTAGFSVGKYIAHATHTGSYNNENQFIPYTPANNETTNYNNMVARGFTPLNSRTVSQYEAAYRAQVMNLNGSEENLTVNEIVQVLGNMYGNKISYTSYADECDFAVTDMEMLIDNNPVIFEFVDSDYYGQRIVAVCGYKLYNKTTSFLEIIRVQHRQYLEYKDGTTKEQSMWIDFNHCLGKCGGIYSININ